MKGEPTNWGGKVWRSGMALVLCLAPLGCATTPRVKVTAEVTDPGRAASRSVAVVADSFMDDSAAAENVAELLRQQMVLQGFNVKQTEDEAELIVIPTIERSAATGDTALPARMRRPFEVSQGLGQTSLMESQNAMRNLGFEFGTLPDQEQPRIGLMVTAVSREAWSSALVEPQAEIARVWRIVAISSVRKQDVTPYLVEAVGIKLSEISAPPVRAAQPTETPTPSPTPKKKRESEDG